MERKWVVLGSVSDIDANRGTSMWFDDTEFVVWQGENGKVCVANAKCPHRGASLTNGSVRIGILSCPVHGWRFNSEGANVFRPDGQPLSSERLRCYPARECGGGILADLSEIELMSQQSPL